METMNVVIPVKDDEFDNGYKKDVAYDIVWMSNGMVTFAIPYGNNLTIDVNDTDFKVWFNVTLKELHTMGFVSAERDNDKPITSWMVDAIKEAFEKCYEDGRVVTVNNGLFTVEAEWVDYESTERSMIEMTIKKDGQEMFKWVEGDSVKYW